MFDATTKNWDKLQERAAQLGTTIFGQAGGTVTPIYPGNTKDSGNKSVKNYVTEVKRENWLLQNNSARLHVNDLKMYGFRVMTGNDNKALAGNDGVKWPGFGDMDFNMNPQQLTLDDNYAISMTPTLGGVVVEHNSIVFRDLTIRGLSGIQPERDESGVDEENKYSGYEWMHYLMNYMRSYAHLKKINPQNKDLKLIFVNRKDNEQLIVEPVKITRTKAVPKKMLYEYTLVFRVIGIYKKYYEGGKCGMPSGVWDKIKKTYATVMKALKQANLVLVQAQKLINQLQTEVEETILGPIRAVSALLQSLASTIVTAINMPGKLLINIASGFMDSVKAVAEAFASIDDKIKANYSRLGGTSRKTFSETKTESSYTGRTASDMSAMIVGELQNLGVSTADISTIMTETDLTTLLTADQLAEYNAEIETSKNITVGQVQTLRNNVSNLSDKLADYIGKGNTEYDTIYDRSPLTISKEETVEDVDVLKALLDTKAALDYIVAYPEDLFIQDSDTDIQNVQNFFDNNIEIESPQSIIEVVLGQNETLEQLAMRYLGDINKWIDIANLNKLKPPFIDEASTSKNILKPGDTVLIPSLDASTAEVPVVTKKTPINEDLTSLETFLGIDSLLDDTYDFRVENNDIKLVAGIDNAKQAIANKIRASQGDYPYHPTLGLNVNVGEKNIITATEIYDKINDVVSADDRFEGFNFLGVVNSGNSIEVEANLKLKYVNNPVPVTLRI
jgi:hypothetical protein